MAFIMLIFLSYIAIVNLPYVRYFVVPFKGLHRKWLVNQALNCLNIYFTNYTIISGAQMGLINSGQDGLHLINGSTFMER